MATKLFVGSLPYSVTDDQLETIFKEAGAVEEAKVITDRYTNQSKGFGFVTMATEEDAKTAIEQINGKEVDGRRITVNEARPQENRERRPGGGNGGGGGGFRGGDRGDRGGNNHIRGFSQNRY